MNGEVRDREKTMRGLKRKRTPIIQGYQLYHNYIMLSKIELEFLKSPENFDADYRRVLRYRVNLKVQELREEIELLQKCGFGVTENCNGVTEFCNGQQSLNQAAFSKRLELGMGIEPIYNSSAGCRLNHSATPAWGL